eukprot:TRINITY_DN304_c0_g1_i1.p1 TRINITY_DN304_c0_g1~~TRINITY_DN304_c0_g1_i1.p1  ORF type:complete len:1205 (-),score=223.99 TRINITY_DN304_c0_g1_i1:1337-4951(-)
MEYAPDNEEPTQHPEMIAISQPPHNLPYLPPPPITRTSPQSPSKDDFVSQLTEKIRQQARELQEQENYKIICEKRILELCPNHPLPVTPAHLGKIVPGATAQSQALLPQINELKKLLTQKDQELHFAKKRSEKLQLELEQSRHYTPKKAGAADQTGRIAELQREKQNLEESLRAEILTNEEQRNYIQILKEALEAKIEDLGFSEILNQARTAKPAKQVVDLFAEMANMKKVADHHRKELAKYESVALEEQARGDEFHKRATDMEAENGELKKSLDEVQEDLNNAMKALEEAREVNAKLDEEKNSLLDYVEELTDKHDQMASNLESLNMLHKKLSEEKLECDRYIEELERGSGNRFEEELEKRDKKLELYKAQVEKYAEQVRTLKEKCEEKVNAVADALGRLDMDRELNETRAKKLQDALTSLHDIKNDSMAQVSRAKEQLEATIGEDRRVMEYQIDSLNNENKNLTDKVANAVKANSALMEDKKKLQENYSALNNTLNDLQNELEQIRQHSNSLEEQNKVLAKQLEESKRKNEEQARTISKFSDEQHQKREVVELKDELQKVRDELNKTKSELIVHKKEAKLKGDEIRIFFTERDQYKRELEQLQGVERQMKEELERTFKSYKGTDKTIEELHGKLAAAQNQIQDQGAEILALEAECNSKQRELSALSKENQEMKKQLTHVFQPCYLIKKQREQELSTLKVEASSAEAKLKQQALRNEDLMEQLNQLTSEFDSLHAQHQGTLTQMDFLRQKTDEESDHYKKRLMHLEELKTALNGCLSIISSFAKQFDPLAVNPTQIQSVVSRKFRDIVSTFVKYQPLQDLYGLDDAGRKISDFVRLVTEELEVLSKAVVSQKAESQILTQKVFTLESKCSTLTIDEEGMKERERYLKAEADNLREEKRKLELEREIYYKREKQLEGENYQLRMESDKAKRENEKLESQMRQAAVYQERSVLEYKQRTLTAERENLQLRNAEEKIDFLTNEKRDLEMLLAKLSNSMPSAEMQRTVSSLIKTQSDLHMALREKHRLTAALMQAEGTLRTHISATATITDPSMGLRLRKDVERLRDELASYEERIELDKKQLSGLEDELKGLEIGERRKATVFIDNEKLLADKRKRIEELERKGMSMRYEVDEPKKANEKTNRSFVGDSISSERADMRRYKEDTPSRTYAGQEDLSGRSTLQQRLMQVKSSFSTIGGGARFQGKIQ